MSSGSYANPLLRSFIVAQRTAYQLTRGRIGGRTLGADTMLLTTRGARSSEPRTTPLIYLRHGEDWVIFATDNASDRNPAWYHNLRAHREAEVQIGAERFRVRATLVPEPERGSLWEQGKRRVERFSTYEQRTSRPAIPVFRLRRIDAGDRSRDVESIRTLIYRYAELLDSGDVDGFAQLFASGALRVAGTDTAANGSAAVRELVSKSMRFYDGTPGTRHVNTNTIVTLASDGERAETRTTFTVFQCLPDFPLQAIVVGRYLDRFELGAHGWQFEEREIAMDLIGDVSRHLAALP